jgi:hypothetical protein
MDRRYYLAKLGMVVVAVALAVTGTGMCAHGLSQFIAPPAQHGAAAQLQAATWRAATSMGRYLACLVSHNAKARL